MSLVRSALLALLGAHGGVAGVVRPTQPVVHQIHAEANHASSPAGKIPLKQPREVSKKTAKKQGPSPHASTIPKQGELAAHEGVAGAKHSKQPVVHQKFAEAPIVKLSAWKTSSKAPLDDDANKLGEAYARAFGKKTATNQAPNPHTATSAKQGKLAAHEGVASVKHSKQPVAHQDDAESPTMKLFAGKTSSKDPLDDDARKLGEAYARAFAKKTATKRAPGPHVSTSSKKGRLAAHEGVNGVRHSKQPVEAPMVKLSAWKSSSKEPLDEDMQKLGEAYAREFGEKPSPKKSVTSEVSSTQLQGNNGTSTEKPKRLSAKPSPVQIQDRLSDNAEHMIETAMD